MQCLSHVTRSKYRAKTPDLAQQNFRIYPEIQTICFVAYGKGKRENALNGLPEALKWIPPVGGG